MTVKEQLQLAKKAIETRGWIQNFYEVGKEGVGPMCLVGAGLVAALGDEFMSCNFYDDLQCLVTALGFTVPNEAFKWNDAPGRTREEVIARIDDAIARLETEQ